MKTKQGYLEDIVEIKQMMQKSSRFISLSGLSGIMAGVYALARPYLAYSRLYVANEDYSYKVLAEDLVWRLVFIAAGVLILAISTGILITTRKAKAQNLSIWDYQAKRLVLNLLIPLATGGILCLILVYKGIIGIVAPLTLIFYGLALVNASKYSLHDIRTLGVIEIILGLMASFWIGYGLLFWAIGFGFFHIIYGTYMYLKYEK